MDFEETMSQYLFGGMIVCCQSVLKVLILQLPCVDKHVTTVFAPEK